MLKLKNPLSQIIKIEKRRGHETLGKKQSKDRDNPKIGNQE